MADIGRSRRKKSEYFSFPSLHSALRAFFVLFFCPFCPLSPGFSSASRWSVLTLPSTLTPSSAVLFLFFTASNASFTMLSHFYFLTIFISDHLYLHLATLLILLTHLPFLEFQCSNLLRAQGSFILCSY